MTTRGYHRLDQRVAEPLSDLQAALGQLAGKRLEQGAFATGRGAQEEGESPRTQGAADTPQDVQGSLTPPGQMQQA